MSGKQIFSLIAAVIVVVGLAIGAAITYREEAMQSIEAQYGK